MEFFHKPTSFPFMATRKVWYGLSAILMIASITLLATRSLNFAIDFTGGATVEAKFPKTADLDAVRARLAAAGIRDAQAKAERELAAVGLAQRAGHYPAELSGGEQQRVALARALAPDPAIIVADEPTGNLDEATGRDIIELLFRGHSQRGTTLVLVTHDAALAARCNRVLHMRSGRIEEPARAANRNGVGDIA